MKRTRFEALVRNSSQMGPRPKNKNKHSSSNKIGYQQLPFALHAYRTAVRTSTRAIPFSLVYRMEAVLPIEVEIPSLQVLMEATLEEAEWVQARYDQLNLIEEKRSKKRDSKLFFMVSYTRNG